MSIRMLSGKDAHQTLSELTEHCVDFSVAVAWAGSNSIIDAMLDHSHKLRKLVIGTHMYQTSPIILRKFKSHFAARCHHPTGPLFHPKVYLFDMGDRRVSVVGSHNLTAGAFDGGNIEVSVLVDGMDVHAHDDLEGFVEQQWRNAKPINEDFLYAYEVQYRAKEKSRKNLASFSDLRPPKKNTAKRVVSRTWKEFVADVKGDRNHTVNGRLLILERAAGLFREYGSLDRMPLLARKGIGGTYGKAESQLDDLDWRWFGSMQGSGVFATLILNEPELLSRALDLIPPEGYVDESLYETYCEAFDQSFEGQPRSGRLPVASRLLAMKRPDVFAAVNGKNRDGICGSFGVASSTLNLSNYWERIVLPIQNSEWWCHPRPRDPLEGRIWDNRAALLDSIYYEPD